MEPTLLTANVDMSRVLRLAHAGVERLAATDPAMARVLRRSIEEAGGAAITVARWEDPEEAAIAVGVVEVWRGELAAVLLAAAIQ